MVLYSETAKQDLRNILWGLTTWEKHPLGYDHAMNYVSDIRKSADQICHKTFHINTVHPMHKLYGDKIHTYRRNPHTHWYILYNWDATTDTAFVTKILNNYLTV